MTCSIKGFSVSLIVLPKVTHRRRTYRGERFRLCVVEDVQEADGQHDDGHGGQDPSAGCGRERVHEGKMRVCVPHYLQQGV